MLSKIQKILKVPKKNYNAFGKYKYRSAEDILETVKPILAKENIAIILTDEIVPVNTWIYVKSTAKLLKDNKIIAETSAFARESETKKGMDAAQITGSVSSYARKYALNGLFAIDDSKEIDGGSNENAEIINELEIILDEFSNYDELKNKMVAIRDKYIKKGLSEIMTQKIIKNRLLRLK